MTITPVTSSSSQPQNSKPETLCPSQPRLTTLALASLVQGKASSKDKVRTQCKKDFKLLNEKVPFLAKSYARFNGLRTIVDGSVDIYKCEEYGVDDLGLALRRSDNEAAKLIFPKVLDKVKALFYADNPQKSTKLFVEACESGDMSIVQALLSFAEFAGIEIKNLINAEGAYGRNSILAAAHSGNLELLKLLESLGADLAATVTDETSPYEGYSALHCAAHSNSSAMLRYIIPRVKTGVNDQTKDFSPRAPLHIASEKGNVEAMAALVEAGADVNLKVNDHKAHTPLFLAIDKGQDAAAVLLIWNKADLNAGATTPLCHALANIHFSTAEQLVLAGADVNKGKEGYTPLYTAAGKSNLDMIKLLLKHGAKLRRDPSIPRPSSITGGAMHPLGAAIQKGRVELASYLLEQYGKLTKQDIKDLETMTPLRWVLPNNAKSIAIAQALIHAGLNVDAPVYADNTTLMMVCKGWGDQVAKAKLLVDWGADFNRKNKYNETPLYNAAQHGNMAIVRFLLSEGADPKVQGGRFKTPAQVARRYKHEDIAKLLDHPEQIQGAKGLKDQVIRYIRLNRLPTEHIPPLLMMR